MPTGLPWLISVRETISAGQSAGNALTIVSSTCHASVLNEKPVLFHELVMFIKLQRLGHFRFRDCGEIGRFPGKLAAALE